MRDAIFPFSDCHHRVVLHLIMQLSQSNINISVVLLTEASLGTCEIFYSRAVYFESKLFCSNLGIFSL